MKKFLRIGATTLALSLVLTGCGGQDTSTDEVQDDQNPTEVEQNIDKQDTSAPSDTETSEVFDLATFKEDTTELKTVSEDEANGTIYQKTVDNQEQYLFEGFSSDKGWATIAYIAVEDGEIIDSYYNYVNDIDELKTDDEEYIEAMKEKTGNDMAQTISYYQETLKTGNVDELDADIVSGATHSTDEFQIIAKELYSAAGIEK